MKAFYIKSINFLLMFNMVVPYTNIPNSRAYSIPTLHGQGGSGGLKQLQSYPVGFLSGYTPHPMQIRTARVESIHVDAETLLHLIEQHGGNANGLSLNIELMV